VGRYPIRLFDSRFNNIELSLPPRDGLVHDVTTIFVGIAATGYRAKQVFIKRELIAGLTCWLSAETGQIVNRDFELISRAL
jgi:hypothetical protein